MTKFTAYLRAFRGYCPRCNGDAPAIDSCLICKSYRGDFPPPAWLSASWLARHLEPIRRRRAPRKGGAA